MLQVSCNTLNSNFRCAALAAYNALLCGYAPLKAGDTVLINGTGGVSIFTLQFAVASDATVIAISSSDEKLKIAEDLGVTHIINYRTTPDWDREALKLTGGVGVDRVIENGVTPVNIVVPTILRSLKLRGLYSESVPQFHDMNKLTAAKPKTTRPVIDRVFPFEEAEAAFAYIASRAHVGKAIFRAVSIYLYKA
ncbi:hypothetical protein B0H13DRAFT_1875243 [Mycena leptocephala]|nr:hypothetical protein B0H13DRAFT_1875243 [Mycena leptocephala]